MHSFLAGSKVEVGWAITYNHGGGCAFPRSPVARPFLFAAADSVRACLPDQYRLCPKDSELTEACFQQHPLDYDRTKQALLFNNGSRYPLKGIFVSEGTKPAGSTWARNPVRLLPRPFLVAAADSLRVLPGAPAGGVLQRRDSAQQDLDGGLGGVPAPLPVGLLGPGRLPEPRYSGPPRHPRGIRPLAQRLSLTPGI